MLHGGSEHETQILTADSGAGTVVEVLSQSQRLAQRATRERSLAEADRARPIS
jgi:hypothetical protein